MPVGLRGKRQSLLHFAHGQRRRVRPGQSERQLPRGREVPSGVLPEAPGFAAAGGEEGRESGTVRTSGRGGAGLQTAESNGCRVKKWDRLKLRTLPARPREEKGAK